MRAMLLQLYDFLLRQASPGALATLLLTGGSQVACSYAQTDDWFVLRQMAQQYGPTSRKWLPWSRTSSAEEYDIEMGLPCPQPHAHQLPRAGKVN